MIGFLKYPNLPQGRVTHIIASDMSSEIIDELENNYHIKTIVPSPLGTISGMERYHADMSVCHLGENRFVSEKDNRCMIKTLTEMGADIAYSGEITGRMPRLNVCFLKDKVIGRESVADNAILNYCREKDIRFINVSQRYAGCSTAVVNENAVITSDESIYKKCIENHIDVLKTDPSGIRLEGYDHGFIGGCCGLISGNILAFSGDIRTYKDHDNIRSFLKNYSVQAVSLAKGELTDIGGLLPIMEEK